MGPGSSCVCKFVGGSWQVLSSIEASPLSWELPSLLVWGGQKPILGCKHRSSPFLHALLGYLLEVGYRALLPPH